VDQVSALERPLLTEEPPPEGLLCPVEGMRELAGSVRGELRHADELAGCFFGLNGPRDLDDAIARRPQLFRVGLRVPRAMNVATSPIGVAAEHLVMARGYELFHDLPGVNDIGIRRHEPFAEVVASFEERKQDVVILPVVVVDVRELRVTLAYHLG